MTGFKKSLSWLGGAHITTNLDDWHARAFRILNSAIFLLMAATTLSIGSIFQLEYGPRAIPIIFAVNTAFQILIIISFILLRRGHVILTGFLMCLGMNFTSSFFSFAIPDEPVLATLAMLMMLPYLIIPRRFKYWRYAITFLPAIWILAHQIYFRVIGGEALFGPLQWIVPANRVVPPFVLGVIIVFLLLNQFTNAIDNAEAKLKKEHALSEKLLLNILPAEIATELKTNNQAAPRHFESASICFTDFKGFTKIAESLTPSELVSELDKCFSYFDNIMPRHNLEKLKTIGDSYMFAGGIPTANKTHAIDCVMAALEIQAFMHQMKEIKESQGLPYWELRLGIHSGDLVAGVIGEKKFAYDVWSDTVNTASRCESSGVAGRINISGATYELVKDFFVCEYRGQVEAKNKGMIEMYFVNGLQSDLHMPGEDRVPNKEFERLYKSLTE